MQTTKHDGNTVTSWDECGWKPRKEAPAPKTMKLSEAIREFGYGHSHDYRDCALGHAYKRVMGHHSDERHWHGLSGGTYSEAAADAFKTPWGLCKEAERMCIRKSTPAQIADWLESKGY